jgi:hypothetical protein
MGNRPTLLNSCAYAATAAEARFRINAGPRTPRSSRLVALDAGASTLIASLAADIPPATHLLAYDSSIAANSDGAFADIMLATPDGARVRLSDELTDADFIMMVATANDGADGATAIGDACGLRGIMTAGLVLADGAGAGEAVTALRPHAHVLLVTADRGDLTEIMTAVGG